ncbi:hypothetical protein ACIBCD_29400 [Nocardia brasiliensis]|uniref:hypothetical protein n=1 Tax=Nocardia brasiliensis TaxID=37326 RepID=UPI0037A7A667
MRSLLVKIVSILVALTASIKLVFSLKPADQGLSSWNIVLLTLAIGFSVLAISVECFDYWDSRPKRYSDAGQIRDHMFDLIKDGGRVSVFTRDLSWVDDTQMMDMLRSKAEGDNLTLVMPKRISKSEELQKAGAFVIYYGSHYTIKSRFTICNMDRVDSTVSIGRRSGKKHVIEKYEQKDGHPAYALAQDLAGVLRSAGA